MTSNISEGTKAELYEKFIKNNTIDPTLYDT